MSLNFYREYCLKFYLNTRHYIIIDGKKGEVHPHTWEFAVHIRFGGGEFVEFNTFEKGIEEYLDKYQNIILNEVKPFDAILPTLENVADYFARDFFEIIRETGGLLVSVEASETPTRSYVINLEEKQEYADISEKTEDQILGDVVDSILDSLITQED
ncbi:MAG: 6-carboxytetrahydropterin synthase [Lachnospiraceae bacterium]